MERKQLSITLPEDIISDIDQIASESGSTANSLIESMIKLYLAEKRRIESKAKMEQSYLEMGDINLSIANRCFDADQAAQDAYEHYIMGCD